MKHSVESDVLTIYLEGTLSSSNSEAIEEEINALLSSGDFKSIRIDMDGLEYMSSAGIRIIITLKQRYDDTAVVNVPTDVYDVFDMVGLPAIMRIEAK